MPHDISLITTLATSLGLAFIMGFIAVKLRLPVLLGYLIAGILIGPATPGFVADIHISSQLAEIGIMLLMFGVGLHFSIDDLLAVRKIALPGAIVQIIAATALSIAITLFWGWKFGEGLVFGLALSVASTVVLLKALEQQGILKSVNGQIAVGWLVVEDLAMVLVLVLLSPLAAWLGDAPITVSNNELLWSLGQTLGKIAIFIALMLIVGRRIFPWILWQVGKTNSRELFTLCVIGAAVGIAYGSAELFGVSFALGAFFAGMVLRESHLSHRAAEESLPLRDAFSVLFFVSVGMLFDPNILIQQPLAVLTTVFIIVLGKSFFALGLVLMFRYPLNTALIVSISLAQIGEFSFILASLSVSLGLLTPEKQNLILAGAIISIALNSFLFRAINPLQCWLNTPVKSKYSAAPPDPLAELPLNDETAQIDKHIVIIGYGRVGQRVATACAQQHKTLVIAEQNREQVEKLRAQKMHAVAGDAAQPEVLIQAHIVRAAILVIAISNVFQARQIIETARILNPNVKILVRTHSDEEFNLLQQENVDRVFFGEQELAQSIIQHILKEAPDITHSFDFMRTDADRLNQK